MNVKDRIIQFIDYKGISVNQFERQIGFSRSYISNTKNISAEAASLILRVYSELSAEWILTGEGPMLREERVSIPEKPIKSAESGVPYYNVDFTGGFDLIMNDQTVNPEYLIDFPKYNEATCWCNVTGHSMEPEITHGDIIALKKIDDISFLPYGEIYAIVTKNEMRTIKRIGPSQNKDCYSLIPTNKSPEYGVQELPKEMVMIVFKVLGCMKRL